MVPTSTAAKQNRYLPTAPPLAPDVTCVTHVIDLTCRGTWLYLVAVCAPLLCSCARNETSVLLQPNETLGVVLAEETARIAGTKKQVAVISPDANWGPASTAEEAFKSALKKQGLSIVADKAVNLGDPMRRERVGLKAGDFSDLLAKSADVGAIVSFVGAPILSPTDTSRVPREHPPVLVVATASLGNVQGVWTEPADLARLLESKIIQLAIIDGASESASPPNSDAARQQFAQHFRILRRPD